MINIFKPKYISFAAIVKAEKTDYEVIVTVPLKEIHLVVNGTSSEYYVELNNRSGGWQVGAATFRELKKQFRIQKV